MRSIKIYCDGGARGNPGPAASAFLVFEIPEKLIFSNSFYLGSATNNVAEYRAVLGAYEWLEKNLEEYKSAKINFFLDSLLVVKQLKGEYKIKNFDLGVLANKIHSLQKKFSNINYQHIPREENVLADKLVNECLDENIFA